MKVLIGPADIRFELWFDNQKLSRDQSIKVEWVPVPTPDLALQSRAELPEARPSYVANPLAGWKSAADPRGQEGGTDQTDTERKKGIGKMHGGLVSMARNSRWSVYN